MPGGCLGKDCGGWGLWGRDDGNFGRFCEGHSMSEFPTINRIAITLSPTEACLDWINSCGDREMTLAEIQREPTVFLLPEGRAEPDSLIRRYFKALLEEELNGWYTDPRMWPRDLSFETFKRFFTIQVSAMVFDLGSGQIVREED